MIRLSTLLAALALLPACGATQSVTMMSDAEAQLAEARTAGAQHQSPYEYHAAEVYLAQAHEEAGLAEYEWATELASRARDLAFKAREQARSGSRASQPPPLPKGPDDP